MSEDRLAEIKANPRITQEDYDWLVAEVEKGRERTAELEDQSRQAQERIGELEKRLGLEPLREAEPFRLRED